VSLPLRVVPALLLLVPFSVQGGSEESLVGCRALADDAQRLSCYDRAVDRAREALSPPATASAPTEPAERGAAESAPRPQGSDLPAALDEGTFGRVESHADRTLRDLFGLREADELASEVAGVEKAPNRTFTITLVNGQVWRQKDSTPISLRVGDRIQIQKGALGAFYLQRQGGGRRIAVKREE